MAQLSYFKEVGLFLCQNSNWFNDLSLFRIINIEYSKIRSDDMGQKQVGGLIILFGATGDLAERDLFPALHQIYQRGLLSENFAVIGASRTKISNEEFRDHVKESVNHGVNFSELEQAFLDHFYYQAMDNTKKEDYDQLLNTINEVENTFDIDSNYIYYYSISPSLFDDTTSNLESSGVTNLEGDHRVLVEKPFGEDLDSAKDYYGLITNVFDKEDVYFIDHFNAMEYTDNILLSRYANPVINQMIHKDTVENIQISLPENLAVGDRGSFYDANGALLDMFQNHLLQIVTMVTMELPENLDAASIHQEKLKVLKSIPEFNKETTGENIVRGQYDKDFEGKFVSYRNEPGVEEGSLTDTYIAAKLSVDLDHLAGVPIYVRTGKGLIENYRAVDVLFKGGNRLTFHIEPEEGMEFVVDQIEPEVNGLAKTVSRLGPDLDNINEKYIPQPYENILYGGLSGDKTLFITFDEIKEQWRITDSIVNSWKEMPDPKFPNYTANTFGPAEADELLEKDGHQWIKRPSK